MLLIIPQKELLMKWHLYFLHPPPVEVLDWIEQHLDNMRGPWQLFIILD